jgi:hypothetical protein
MVKRVIIEFSLVEESAGKVNQELVNDMFNDLSEAISEGRIIIPWCKKVEKVAVIENN